jgi:hypothetical protein
VMIRAAQPLGAWLAEIKQAEICGNTRCATFPKHYRQRNGPVLRQSARGDFADEAIVLPAQQAGHQITNTPADGIRGQDPAHLALRRRWRLAAYIAPCRSSRFG